MTADPSPADSTSSPSPAAPGPLAAFKRTAGESAATPAAAESAPPLSPPAAPRNPPPPRGKGNRGPRGGGAKQGDRGTQGDRPPRDKQAAENADVDRAIELERQSRREAATKSLVPVPNRRQKSEELEAEVAAALGGMSLDDMVAQELKSSPDRLENESRHRAQVAEIHGDDVFFTLGGKNQGVASLRSFTSPTGEVVPPQVGDRIEVVVTGLNPEDNLYDLAIPGAAIVASKWTDVAEGSLVEAKITGANTGGLECEVAGTRGFIPASQVSLFRIENFGDYVGQKLVCVVTESNERRGNLVLSRRAILEREKEESKKTLLAELEPGQMREGTVRKLQDFGAFVDLGGVDGLIHVSQMSWERVKHPSEVLKEGQAVRVRVEKIDRETGKIGLSLKNPEEHPWTGIEQRFPVGSLVRGPVSRIAQFGAFVKLAPGVEGLIHISELAHHKVFRVENVVKEGEEVECKVLSVDAEAQRMSLSLKATIAKAIKESDKPKDQPEVEEPPREPVVPKRSGPLKGGAGKTAGGEQFGLKW